MAFKDYFTYYVPKNTYDWLYGIYFTISIVSISLFYLGLVGYNPPNKFIAGIFSIIVPIIILGSIGFFIADLINIFQDNDDKKKTDKEKDQKKSTEKESEKKEKYDRFFNKLIYMFGFITVFFWAKFAKRLFGGTVFYGEGIIYNPLSILGAGGEWYGTPVMLEPMIGGKKKYKKRKQKGGQPPIRFVQQHNFLTKIYSYILTAVSAS